jgi:hypothetical protein
MYIINAHWLLMGLWKLIKPFLDPIGAQKILVKAKKYDDMYKYIDRENLEVKYGGKLPNLKEGEYFPPKLM